MSNKYKSEDGIKVYIDDREYIDGVPIVEDKNYYIRLREFLKEIKYQIKKIKRINN